MIQSILQFNLFDFNIDNTLFDFIIFCIIVIIAYLILHSFDIDSIEAIITFTTIIVIILYGLGYISIIYLVLMLSIIGIIIYSKLRNNGSDLNENY